jgi:hypothetical protein
MGTRGEPEISRLAVGRLQSQANGSPDQLTAWGPLHYALSGSAPD